MGQARRILGRAAVLAAVPRGRDDERAGALGDRDHPVDQRVADLGAETEVDDALAYTDRGVEAADHVACADPDPGRARVPEIEVRLRVDTDDAQVVPRRRGDRRDGGPVFLLPAGRAL